LAHPRFEVRPAFGVSTTDAGRLSFKRNIRITLFMAKSANNVMRKKRGRPRVEKPAPVSAVRLPHDLTEAIDKWGNNHEIGRSEAIRQLIVLGLKAKK
jgi:hypothetical protein